MTNDEREDEEEAPIWSSAGPTSPAYSPGDNNGRGQSDSDMSLDYEVDEDDDYVDFGSITEDAQTNDEFEETSEVIVTPPASSKTVSNYDDLGGVTPRPPTARGVEMSKDRPPGIYHLHRVEKATNKAAETSRRPDMKMTPPTSGDEEQSEFDDASRAVIPVEHLLEAAKRVVWWIRANRPIHRRPSHSSTR